MNTIESSGINGHVMQSGRSTLQSILSDLKFEIDEEICSVPDSKVCTSGVENRKKIIEDIENIVLDVIGSLTSNIEPTIVIRNQRLWSNCSFNNILELKQRDSAQLFEIKFSSRKTNKDFAQIIFLLWKIYQLLSQNTFSLRREIYYENLNLFENQSQLDSVADRVSCLLGVPQWEIGLFASSKGLVAGDLQLISHSFKINCSVQGGIMIPPYLPAEVDMISNAKFILVVEKDSAFQKLCDEGLLEHLGPCIMITGKGYPDTSTRLLVKLIREKLKLPTFILVDCDPHGIEIMFIYKFGSLKQSHIGNRLAIPSAKWIGVHPTDIKDFNVQSEDLSRRDIKKVNCLLSRPYIDKEKKIKNQLNFLNNSGKKSEIEGLVQISQGFLTDVYIPMKISSKQFI